MPRCLILQYSVDFAESIRNRRRIQLDVDVRDLEWVMGLEYVALVHGSIPYLAGRVSQLVFPAGFSGKAFIELDEARNLGDRWGNEVSEAYALAHLSSYRQPISYCDFANTDFYTLGDPYGMSPPLDRTGAVTLKSVITLLSKTYDVDPSQVKITISSYANQPSPALDMDHKK